MKKYILSLAAALLLIGQIFSPVMASTAAACGDTYTVQSGDYLSKIARTCGVTLSSLITANPQISDLNRIYPGQVIRIKAGSTLPTPVPTTPPASGTTYTVQRGDTLYKISVRFGVSMQSLLNANTSITNPSRIYVGQVLRIPSATDSGVPVTGTRISLSTNRVKSGGSVEVKVWNFPANASIDLRIGKEGQAYTSVIDARTGANGTATIQVVMPGAAKNGEKWVIKAMTTELVKSVEATSPVITIIQ